MKATIANLTEALQAMGATFGFPFVPSTSTSDLEGALVVQFAVAHGFLLEVRCHPALARAFAARLFRQPEQDVSTKYVRDIFREVAENLAWNVEAGEVLEAVANDGIVLRLGFESRGLPLVMCVLAAIDPPGSGALT